MNAIKFILGSFILSFFSFLGGQKHSKLVIELEKTGETSTIKAAMNCGTRDCSKDRG